jgi:hypothetical protein
LELCRLVDFKASPCLSFSCRKKRILINLNRKGWGIAQACRFVSEIGSQYLS